MEQFSLEQFLHSGAYMRMSPTHLLVGWGTTSSYPSIQTDHTTPYFYINNFFLNIAAPWIQFEHSRTMTIDQFAHLVGQHPSQSVSDWMIDSPRGYHQAFHQLMQLLNAGHLNKGVPYVFSRSKAEMTPKRLCSAIEKSLEALRTDSNHVYGYWNETSGVLGVTPEILFTHSGKNPQKVQTMALAGTCDTTEPASALLENRKILNEHTLVVNGIKETCSHFGEVCPSDRRVMTFPKVSHLMTPIVIKIRIPFEFQHWVEALHPTPALGTFPKNAGRQWLEEQEKALPRQLYGAPLGFVFPAEELSTCFVAIRNIQWDFSGLSIGAGGGVVRESQYEKEWQEIQLKTQAIKELLGL